MFEDETPVAWQAVPAHAPVVGADGSEIGIAESVLGDEEQDIFHGIVLRRSPDGEKAELPARRSKKMTSRRAIICLRIGDLGRLPPSPAGRAAPPCFCALGDAMSSPAGGRGAGAAGEACEG